MSSVFLLPWMEARSWGRFSTCPAFREVFRESYFTRNQNRFLVGQVENLPHVDDPVSPLSPFLFRCLPPSRPTVLSVPPLLPPS